MPESAFFAYWKLGYILGIAVVLAVAALLIVILMVARNIERLGGAALGIAGRIEQATLPIWSLAVANSGVEAIVGTVHAVEAEAVRIADTLSPPIPATPVGGPR